MPWAKFPTARAPAIYGCVEEIRRSIAQIETITQQNAALVEEATATSEALADESRELRSMFSQFTWLAHKPSITGGSYPGGLTVG